MITQVRRWLPDRLLVVVADRSYAAIELLAVCAGLPEPVSMITRQFSICFLYGSKTNDQYRFKDYGARQPPHQSSLNGALASAHMGIALAPASLQLHACL